MLLPVHEEAGATLGKGPGGARVVSRYEDPRTELEHRGAVLLHDAGHLAAVRVTGPDALPFCRDILASDVAGLPDEGGAQPSLLLTPKGKVVAQVELRLHDPTHVELRVEAPHRERLAEELRSYARFSDVDVEDGSGRDEGADDAAVLLLAGPGSAEVLAEALDVDPPKPHRLADVGDGWKAAAGALGTPHGLLLTGPADAGAELWRSLKVAVEDAGGGVAGFAAVDAARILEGVPAAGREVTGERLPAEVGLEGVVSFTKGCFVGQEVAARVQNVGQVQRHAVLLASREPLEEGGALAVDGDEVGVVTSVTDLAEEPRALGLLRREHVTEGTEVDAGEGTARVLRLVER